MLLTRVLSALVFAPALFWVVYQGGVLMQGMCLGVGLLMLWEYQRMTASITDPWMRVVGYGLGAFLIASLFGYVPGALIKGGMPLGLMLLWLLALARPEPIADSVRRVGVLWVGVFYCCGLFPYLGMIRDGNNGLWLSLVALFSTWGGDTCAYFAGKAFGKHRLYPRISPKKTVEGAVGGLLGGVAVAFILSSLLPGSEVPVQHVGALGLLAAAFGMVGDLTASLLKRSTDTKDSSHLIPGHGGFLDRFDGVMFAAPAVFLYAEVFFR